MYKFLFPIVFALLLSSNASAQNAQYMIVNAEAESQSVVRLELKTFSKDKDLIDKEAQCAAIRAIIFDGAPYTMFHKPILADGEKSSISKHPSYFNSLYSDRYPDFIVSYRALSKFRKADKDKTTLYEVRVKALLLRKDLEKNKIKKQFGL